MVKQAVAELCQALVKFMWRFLHVRSKVRLRDKKIET